MRAAVSVVAEADPRGHAGSVRYPILAAAPPLALRPTPHGLYLAASAAGPLGGDRVDIDVTVRAGATLVLRTVGAAIALPGNPGACSRLRWCLRVGDGAGLELLPSPTVIADGAWHASEVEVDLARSATLVLREQVVLGRHGERGGRWQSRTRVTREGQLVLAQDHDLDGADTASGGPYGMGGHSCFGSVTQIGRGTGGYATGGTWVRMPLAAADAVLAVAVARDAVALADCLDLAAQDPR